MAERDDIEDIATEVVGSIVNLVRRFMGESQPSMSPTRTRQLSIEGMTGEEPPAPPVVDPAPKAKLEKYPDKTVWRMGPIDTSESIRTPIGYSFSQDDPLGQLEKNGYDLNKSVEFDRGREDIVDTFVYEGKQNKEYRDAQYAVMQRMAKDLAEDNRRLREMESALELSRETITDSNI